MADRIFACVMLIVTAGYAYIAFALISAPFQYDPLGPESWPQLLALVAIICLLVIIWKPDVASLGVNAPTAIRLVIVLALLLAYAELFERIGFILSTTLYATFTAILLGAVPFRATLFGLFCGVGGYLLCAVLLGLNLPEGPILRTLSSAPTETTSEVSGG